MLLTLHNGFEYLDGFWKNALSRDLDSDMSMIFPPTSSPSPSPSFILSDMPSIIAGHSDSPCAMPSDSTSSYVSAERESAFFNILTDVSSEDLLLDPSTPQGAAFDWISKSDQARVDPLTYPTVEQRYALAVLYESSGGSNWLNSDGWLSEDEECLWYGITCSDDGFVERISLSK
jgi:hypothetical protein